VLAKNPEKSGSISSRPCPARSRREEGESAVGWGQRGCEIGRERGSADGRGPIVSERKREGEGRALGCQLGRGEGKKGKLAAGKWGGTGPSELGSGLVPGRLPPFSFYFSFSILFPKELLSKNN